MRTRFSLRIRGRSALLDEATAAQLAPAQSAAPDSSALWYREPARTWHEASPVGNGRIGPLVHGGPDSELLHLNEGSVWSGRTAYVEKPEVRQNLPRLRELLFAGKHAEAEAPAKKHLTTVPRLDYGSSQPLGDLRLEFATDIAHVRDYRPELNLDTAVARTTFKPGTSSSPLPRSRGPTARAESSTLSSVPSSSSTTTTLPSPSSAPAPTRATAPAVSPLRFRAFAPR
ncbi:MAG: glycoside hydrolase N-terminal domain-containing protein [Opitutaceae bacterium]|nr:glycoside hydrolase N-terminal domain-containing protein [Opitutaceae bacterium]